MRKEIYWDNCVLKTQIPAVNNEGGQGSGGVSSRVHKQQFCVFHESQNKMVYLISATCLGDLCEAISSPGEPAVGGSKRTEVWSYI